jgi:hypothetical protein
VDPVKAAVAKNRDDILRLQQRHEPLLNMSLIEEFLACAERRCRIRFDRRSTLPRIPMRSLIPATHITGFTLLSRPTSKAARKAALFLFPVAVVLAAGAVRGQPAPDGFDPTPNLSSTLPAQAINLSTRMRVQTGDNIGIGGFIITGSAPKHVLLRAIGPSLEQFGADVLVNPVLELHGPGAFVPITNDNWQDSQAAMIIADGIPPTDGRESAIDATLAPGAYTALIIGLNSSSGIGLIEVYDLDQSVDSKLANISTRAFVDTGDNIVIAGFRLGSNSGNDSVVVRGIGPSLATEVTNALADPTLELRDVSGALLVANNDWRDDPLQAAALTAAGLAPTNDRESGIAVTLPPGLYTALLAGRNNGVGVGMVEFYDRGTPTATGATVTRVQTGTVSSVETQHVVLTTAPIATTFRIVFNQPSTINHSAIGSRAALQSITAPIPFNATGAQIQAAIRAVRGYYAYSQLGNTDAVNQLLSYFAGLGATNREPVVTGSALDGFTIQFGSPVGSPTAYNTWVTGLPLVTIEVP